MSAGLDIQDRAITQTHELRAKLRAKFCHPEYAFFEEVYSSTGWGANRRTDAVAMGLYPSRGLLVHGFEIKVSRADWVREMKDPGKAEEIFGFCDHWWLVVGDRAIVKKDELPPNWGLIGPRGETLAILTQAPRLKPEPLDRRFIAALARRADEVLRAQIAEQVEEQTKDLQARLEKAEGERDELRRRTSTNLAERVREFEKASGVSLSTGYCGPAEIGRAVRAVLENNFNQQRNTIAYHAKQIEGIALAMREFLEATKEVGDGPRA